jgi:hypothetical protein
MSNWILFKTSLYSDIVNVVVKYATYMAMSSMSIIFQKLSKYFFLPTLTICAISLAANGIKIAIDINRGIN